jgi:membrane peptidoglycan carboxypeptidase
VTGRGVDVTAHEWQLAEAPTMPLPTVRYRGDQDAGWGHDGPGAAGYGAVAPRRRRFRWIRRLIGTVVALAVLGALAFTGLLMVLPGVGDAPALAQALDAAHHVDYPGPALPLRLAAALVATEDHRYYAEPGVDLAAGSQMILGTFSGNPGQGGSTLYQQLAKMLYVSGRSGLLAQAEQVLLGIKLDLNFSKAQILQMYADVVYFGHGYYGLAAASCGYFAERPATLSWGQAAMLAGLVQAPSDDPVSHFASARAREAHVLVQLIDTGQLTRQQASLAYQSPLHLTRGGTGACATPAASAVRRPPTRTQARAARAKRRS